MDNSHESQPTSTGTHRGLNRRSVLKLLGGTTLAAGTMIGTASADRSVFSGCRRVCSDTDGNFAVVATDDGYEGRKLDSTPRESDVPWTHQNTFCYVASRGERIVGFINEDQVQGNVTTGEGCTLCLNPNACAQHHHDGGADIVENIDESTIGPCAGNLEVGECTSDGAADSGATSPASDVPLLNYALTLEHLENAFYRDALEQFDEQELMDAAVLTEFGDTVRQQIPEYLRTIGEHEAEHVAAISETIEALGGSPVEEGEYDFGYETPSEFLATAQALEDTGVAAYTGAAPMIADNDVLGPAASIQSVEARHAAFLRLVNGEVPFPNAVQEAASIEEVLDVAGQFVTSEIDPSRFQVQAEQREFDRKADDATSDVEVLNYALSLEHLENAFYRDGLEEFDDDELQDAEVLSGYDEVVRESVPNYLETVGEHEATHVEAISDTIEQLDGTPVEELTYDFGYESASEFLETAAALETTGVSAYRGAAPTVANDEVFSAAVAIHAVEARHSSYLNELVGVSPFPRAFDEPLSMEEVRAIAAQFVVEG